MEPARRFDRFVLKSKPFWLSLALLALIVLFALFTFTRLSNYGERLTDNYRRHQLKTVEEATRVLEDHVWRIRECETFFRGYPGKDEVAAFFRRQFPGADTGRILQAVKTDRRGGAIENWFGDLPGAAERVVSHTPLPGDVPTPFLLENGADSLGRMLFAFRFVTSDRIYFIVSDANRLLRRSFQQSGVSDSSFYWIIEESGRILRFPPQINPMSAAEIYKKNFTRCTGCHVAVHDEDFRANSGTHLVPYPPGRKSLVAWSTAVLPGHHWTVVLTLPSSAINELLNDDLASSRRYYIFAVILCGLLLVLYSVYLHRQILLEAEKKVLKSDLAAAERVRAMETMLEKAQRMEGLSVLAGGLAHEINNPITNIVLYARLARQRIQDSEACADLEIIERESQKVKFIVFDMLSHIRRTTAGHKPKSVDLNGLVDELLEINRALLKKNNITVQCDLAPGLPSLVAEEHKIMQVMVNLFSNAVDAMADGGRITLRTGVEPARADPGSVFFGISDTGTGIPEDQQEKIFEPLFTTKPPGAGTGLGLPVSKAIVEKMGGRISLTSVPGQGTSVKVIFPIPLQ